MNAERQRTILMAVAVIALAAFDCRAQIVENATILYSVGGRAGEFYGDSVDSTGDLSGDGIGDLIAGAPFGSAGGRATVLSGRDGALLFELRAAGAGQQFGWEVAGIGDVSGDSVPDVLVAAPDANGRGAAFVYSGANGALIRTFAGERSGDRFGERIARAGDLDGDGVADLMIAAPSADNGGFADAGMVYLFSGGSGERIATLNGAAALEHFGSAVSGLPDLDGDAIADLAIGAYGGGTRRTGRLEVYSGRTRERILSVDSDAQGATFGRHYTGPADDADGDGLADLVTADIGHRALGSNTGRAYVISSRTGAFVRTYSGTASQQYFGTGTRQIADVDGDLWPDLFVGAAFDGTHGPEAGKAYLYSGRDGTLLHSLTGTRAGATLGARGIDTGDLNGDGLHDLLLTAPTDGTNGQRAGRIYAISGASFPRKTPALRFAAPDGSAVVQGGAISLIFENFALPCTGSGPQPRLRIEVDDQLDHRACTNPVFLQKTYAVGMHKLTATLEDRNGASLASATTTIEFIPPGKRRRSVKSSGVTTSITLRLVTIPRHP